jgi:hypothetical protein
MWVMFKAEVEFWGEGGVAEDFNGKFQILMKILNFKRKFWFFNFKKIYLLVKI